MSNKCACAVEKLMYTWHLYDWHHNLNLSQNSHILSYATHTFKFLHNVKHVISQQRDTRTHVKHFKKNKTGHKIKYFCLFENFNVFELFLINKTTKNR